MTMSLSVARPILTAPTIDSTAVRPGRSIFIIDVAMLVESPTRAVSGSATGAGGTSMGCAR